MTLGFRLDVGVCQAKKGKRGQSRWRELYLKAVIISELGGCKNLQGVIALGVVEDKAGKEFAFICVPHTQHNAYYSLRQKFKV